MSLTFMIASGFVLFAMRNLFLIVTNRQVWFLKSHEGKYHNYKEIFLTAISNPSCLGGYTSEPTLKVNPIDKQQLTVEANADLSDSTGIELELQLDFSLNHYAIEQYVNQREKPLDEALSAFKKVVADRLQLKMQPVLGYLIFELEQMDLNDLSDEEVKSVIERFMRSEDFIDQFHASVLYIELGHAIESLLYEYFSDAVSYQARFSLLPYRWQAR